MATVDNSIGNWDFRAKNVDTAALKDATTGGQGNFISSESCVVVIGPAKWGGSTNDLHPVGLVESAQIAQNKQINQIFEIGSRESYMIPGRTMSQLALSRVMFNGDSLLAALYALSGDDSRIETATQNLEVAIQGSDKAGMMIYSLASDLFNTTFGLGLYINDSENQTASIMYCENCMVQSHQLALQAQNLIVLENVSIRCTAVKTISPTS